MAAAVRKGPGRYTRFNGEERSRVGKYKGRKARHDRRKATVGRDAPQDGLHMNTPGSMNIRKVGRLQCR